MSKGGELPLSNSVSNLPPEKKAPSYTLPPSENIKFE